jgi:nitroreductase
MHDEPAFADVIRRQRMVRPPYQDREVRREVLDRVLADAQKAPSAGFSQGFAFLVLTGDETKTFWHYTRPSDADKWHAPVVVLPLENQQAYLDRYSEPDKAHSGMGGNAAAWPAPYWTVDTSFAAMILLLSANAHGLGAWFFGIFAGERELLEELGVPPEFHPIGAITMGYRREDEQRRGSVTTRPRTAFTDFVHYGRW